MSKCHNCEEEFKTFELEIHNLNCVLNKNFDEKCKESKSTKPMQTSKCASSGRSKNVFKCDLCEKNFAKLIHYGEHMKTIHNNERKFQCDPCDKYFKQKSHLNVHV